MVTKMFKNLFIAVLSLSICFASCSNNGGSSGGGTGENSVIGETDDTDGTGETEGTGETDEGELTFENADTPGDTVSVSVGSINVNMIYANNSETDIVVPYETDDSAMVTVNGKFFISETEITNALFATVLQWARDNDRISGSGTDNLVSSTAVTYGDQELIDLDYNDVYGEDCMKISYNEASGTFAVASGSESLPVVCVSWYGAVMFCNWLTEMRDGNTDNIVYTNIDSTWEDTETLASAGRNGYRLPSDSEWEFAARYNGTAAGSRTDLVSLTTNNPNNLAITDGFFWTPGDYASGATDDYTNVAMTRAMGWYLDDPDMGSDDRVMPAGQKTANQLGIMDMSGNVWEWCFDSYLSDRITRGGSWDDIAFRMQIGYWSCSESYEENSYTGFRIARSR